MSRPTSPLTVLITGASTGFGRRLAERLGARGHRVFGTSRQPAAGDDGPLLLPLDVRSDESVVQCVRMVEDAAGTIDVLVNNAGYVHEGPLEELHIDELRAQFEVNFFGAARMTNAVLPAMRQRKGGHIVYVGSLAGLIPIPFVGAYCASKHALDSYSESLYHELKPLGVRVSVVEPGYFSTGIASRKQRTAGAIADYDAQRKRMYATIAHDEAARAGAPERVVDLLTRIVEGGTRRFRHVLGPDTMTYHLRGLIPESLWEFGMRRATRLDPP